MKSFNIPESVKKQVEDDKRKREEITIEMARKHLRKIGCHSIEIIRNDDGSIITRGSRPH